MIVVLTILFCVGCKEEDNKHDGKNDSKNDINNDVPMHICEGVEWVRTKESTCAEAGARNNVCSCGKIVKTEEIAKKAHTEEIIFGKSATCTETGVTIQKLLLVSQLNVSYQKTSRGQAFARPRDVFVVKMHKKYRLISTIRHIKR